MRKTLERCTSVFSFSNFKCSETCTGLNSTWENVQTTASFPIQRDTVISVFCGANYELAGDAEVTCNRREQFYYNTSPRCFPNS